MKEILKISFDFDGCLHANLFVQTIAKIFIKDGHDVWILTSRDPSLANIDVWKLMDDFGIPKENIIMTNGSLKVSEFYRNNFDLHFDNSYDEVIAINDRADKLERKNDSMPAIMINLDYEELSYAFNTLK